MKKKSLLISYFFVSGLFLMTCLLLGRNFKVSATSTPPITDQVSILDQIYTRLVTSGFGTESSGDHGNFGVKWNRIASSAYWIPDGDATAEDVVTGKTFYGGNRTEQTGTLSLTGDATVDDVVSGKTFYSDSFTKLTGTAPEPIDFSLMQFNEYDDYEGLATGSIDPTNPIDDYEGDEAIWTNTSTNVWKDERTGLFWSADVSTLGLGLPATYSNAFPNQVHTTCPFFSSNPRASYDGLTASCGNAINVCGTLSYDRDNDGEAETDWYLPTQKELMQAYIDGMYNQAGANLEGAATFTTTNFFWSSSEVSFYPTNAWGVSLLVGNTNLNAKASTFAVRCVSRD